MFLLLLMLLLLVLYCCASVQQQEADPANGLVGIRAEHGTRCPMMMMMMVMMVSTFRWGNAATAHFDMCSSSRQHSPDAS